MAEKDTAPRELTTVFQKDGITYVPHYRNASVFVGPGYPDKPTRYSEEELIAAGAVRTEQFLWCRAQHGIITSGRP